MARTDTRGACLCLPVAQRTSLQTEEKRGKDEKAKLHQQLTDLKASLQVREQAEADMQVRRRRQLRSTLPPSPVNAAALLRTPLRAMCLRLWGACVRVWCRASSTCSRSS